MSVIVNGMFAIKVLYNPGCVAALAAIDGRRYDANSKMWWFPIATLYEVSEAVRPYFPMVADRLEKSPRFQEVRDHIAMTRTAVDMSHAVSVTNFPVPHPPKIDYFGYQYAGIQFAYNLYMASERANGVGRNGCLIGDEMGVGKTVQLLGLINKVAEHKGSAPLTLLICPASLKNNWQREARTWLVSKPNILKVESGMPDFYIKRHNFVIINYDILEKYFSVLFSMDWDIIGLDEAHYIKSENAKRSQVCRILCHSEGKSKRPFVVELTGTPLVNRPKELWHLLHCIDPKQWANFTTFAKRYCLQFDKNHRANYNGAKNLAELQRILRTGYMIRRLKADVLKDLPPKRRQIIELGRAKYEKVLAEEQKVRASYDKMVAETDKLDKNLQQAIKNGDAANVARYRQKLSTIDGSTEGIGYGEIAKVRHATALAKVPECCKFISQLLEEKDKVVVFAHHRDVIEAIADNFKKESVVLYGGMGSAEKDNAVQKFLHNKRCRVFVVSITAGGVGLTLTAADTVVFCELDYSPSNNTQAEDRCFVAGTPVLTPKGYVPIERICVGDEVFGGDGKAHKVTDAWSHITDKPLVTVRVWGNVPITCTADHKFMLRNGAWVEASKLKKGDALAYMPEVGNVDYTTPIEVPEEFKIPKTFVNNWSKVQTNGRAKNMPPIQISDEFLYVAGYYLGDGFASDLPRKAGFVEFDGNTFSKKEALMRCKKWAESVGMSVSYGEAKNDRGAAIRCYSLEYARLFKHMFGHGAKNKHLPDWMYLLSRRQIEIVIKGLQDSDGHTRNKTQFGYGTVSDALAAGVVWLLTAAGYKTGYTYAKVARCHYPGAILSHEPNYRVRNNKVREVIPHEPVSTTVYDITVEDAHTFVVGNSVVHNCHRIGQKSCVFVYHLVVEGSIDAHIARKCVEKQHIIEQALDAKG